MDEIKPPDGEIVKVNCPRCDAPNSKDSFFCTTCSQTLSELNRTSDTGFAGKSGISSESPSSKPVTDGNEIENFFGKWQNGKSLSTTSGTDGVSPSLSGNNNEPPSSANDSVYTKVSDKSIHRNKAAKSVSSTITKYKPDLNMLKKDTVTVHFILVLPSSVAFTPDDALSVVFDYQNFQPQPQNNLRFINSFPVNNAGPHCIYTQAFEIDRSLVTSGGKVKYKYVIIKQNYDICTEYLYGKALRASAKPANRKLKNVSIRAQRIFRFDGCFEPEIKEKHQQGRIQKLSEAVLGGNVPSVVYNDHKLAMIELLPTFDTERFMGFDYCGFQTEKRAITAADAVRLIFNIASDFKQNKRTSTVHYSEVFASHFTSVLHFSNCTSDPMVRFTGALVFIQCISLFDCHDLVSDKYILSKMMDNPKNPIHSLNMLLSLTSNIDRSQLYDLAQSINNAYVTGKRTKGLPEAVPKCIGILGLRPVDVIPFYNLITKIPSYHFSAHHYKCIDNEWWVSEKYYLLKNSKVERKEFERVFNQTNSFLTETESSTFFRTILYAYCDEPEHVLQLELARRDPILVVAWIALQWKKPICNNSLPSSFQKFTAQYKLLLCEVIHVLRDLSAKYDKEQIVEFPDILESFISVFEENIDHLKFCGHDLSPDLVADIASMLDASALIFHRNYGENCKAIRTLKHLLKLPLKKSLDQVFRQSIPVDEQFRIMIKLGQVKMEEMREIWVTSLCNVFDEHSQLYQRMDAAQVLQWYCNYNEIRMAEELWLRFDAFFETMIEKNGEHLLNTMMSASVSPEARKKLRTVVTHIFEKQWPKQGSPDSYIIDHMLSWPLMEVVISHKDTLLMEEAVEKLYIGFKLVTSAWDACINGNITLQKAAELWIKKDKFASLISKHYCKNKYEEIIATLEQFQIVQHKFSASVDNIKLLKILLKSEETGVSCLDASASQQVDYILNKNTELCISSVASWQSTDNVVELMFKSPLPLELDQLLRKIRDKKLTMTMLFNSFLKQQLTGRVMLSFDQLASSVIKPTIEKLENTIQIILDGMIPLKHVLELVNIFPPNHVQSSFETEISLLCEELNIGNPSIVELRIDQIHRFLDLHQKSFDCTTLSLLLQKLKLSKCNEEIRVFVEMSANIGDKMLCEMTENLTYLTSTVQAITENRGDCLKTLLEHWDFVQWIRDFAGKSEKELQNFVSIASTYVGESDIEIAKMSDFGKAIAGFSPLIYDIYDVENKGTLTLTQFFDEFLDLVWQSLKGDPKLPAKLAETAKNEVQIKCLYEATGSIEKHSITKTAEINKFGVFTVGCLDKSTLFVNPDDCVKMRLEPGEKCWSMADLRDLRSRLMLIGIQVDENEQTRLEIDNFTKLFDAVAGLASLYIDHRKAGNVLLSQLRCTFYCDPIVSYQLSAKLQDEPPGFESKCTEEMNLVDQIGAISIFLEESLKIWKAHLSKTRQEFPELNYFTSQQLVYLRHQVVQAKKEQCLDPVTAFLLMSLQPEVNAKMVLSALEESVTNMGNEDKSELHTTEQPEEELRYFVDQLIDMGVEDEDVALRAITAKGTDDLDLALDWALSYMGNETEKDGMINEIPLFMEKLSQLTEQLELCSETEPLAVQLQRVWLKYLEVHETRYKELMGLRQLGYLLRHLTSMTVLPSVPCPATIKPNVPNLAILPEIDIPRYVLSLFAQTDFKGLTYENVFVCSERTTAEELLLFLLRIQKPIERAMNYRLFSIVCIDRLTSEVCQAVEVYLNKDLRSTRGFGLVLICAEETSDRCHLAGVLSRYQLKVKDTMLTFTETRSCVQKLLQRQEHISLLEPNFLPQCYSGYLCTSIGYGHGKSEAIRKQQSFLPPHTKVLKIPVYTRILDVDVMFSSLKKHGLVDPSKNEDRLIHLDILDHRVHRVDIFLFQLLILGGFVDSSGNVWRKLPNDCYAIEMTSVANELLGPTDLPASEFRFFLPVIQCHSPAMTKRYLDDADLLKKDCPHILHRLLDKEFLYDERVQRCCAYLQSQHADLTLAKFVFVPNLCNVSTESLNILLENCGVENPSWTELFHFIKFLNTQLLYCEHSIYFLPHVAQDLPGIKNFVVKFLIQMSKDFATRSLVISEDVSKLTKGQEAFEELDQYGLKHQWESTPHPYLFFNADGATISFFGCNFRCGRNSIDLTDSSQEKIIHQGIASRLLYDALITQTRNDQFANDFERPFEKKNQQEKLLKLCRVLGLPDPRMLSDKPSVVGPSDKPAAVRSSNRPATVRSSYKPAAVRSSDKPAAVRSSDRPAAVRSSDKPAAVRSSYKPAAVRSSDKPAARSSDKPAAVRSSDKPAAVRQFTENPDTSYEITTDCALKMLAIEMRFRCDIPVVIMGETGCGKTRLIKYLCDLKKGGKNVENLIILQVHGGVTAEKICADVSNAIQISKTNWHLHEVRTCLFFDEANTTTAISQIKEIVCDHTMDGEKLDLAYLDIIAAVNPYRLHSDEVIQKLEGAGLGYHVQDINNIEKFGDIPMRRLVYRVQPLPPSMIPFVWDFGQLTLETERIYIMQLVDKFVSRIFRNHDDLGNLKNIMVNVLTKAQQFMQMEQNESAFVSLRDVERSLIVMEWFWCHQHLLFHEMDKKIVDRSKEINPITRSLLLALSICYRASLQKKRREFDMLITSCLKDQYAVTDSSTIAKELDACQTVFIENVELEENIAKNEALKENLLMMVMCIELRIPLFLVGKPGSSKSLAKSIVDASMKGISSPYSLFKQLKQAKLVQYQCSPLATADGIEAIFRVCAREQEDVDLNKFVSVAVFDEIGLAEDSPKMPLKALHGLLEEGCAIHPGEKLTNRHKPAFVGISNWALDPAKMNRGIFVNRVLPDKDELLHTAKHICRQGEQIYELVGHLLDPLTDSYLQLYEEQDKDYEFFGLRDFYSLVKMVFDIAMKRCRPPSFNETMHAVTRNFSGTKGKKMSLKFHHLLEAMNLFQNTDISGNDLVIDLITENLAGLPNPERDNRYILVLTENYAAMRALENLPQLCGDSNTLPALTIFGSSFPQDLEYTQICRNINKIKICADTGRPIILLNLETLYESLYDLLNQAFMMYSKERYVEMGLGNHRLKCHVDGKFRLIVVAEAEDVRHCFPSALINRLEKHYMSVYTDLKSGDRILADDLKQWAIKYTSACTKEKSCDPSDMFVGYNDDTAAVIVSDVLQFNLNNVKIRPSNEDVLKFAKQKLLQCAIPESIHQYRENSGDKDYGDWVYTTYLNDQPHNCLEQFLKHWQQQTTMMENKFMCQVTTHASTVLSGSEENTLEEMANAMGLDSSADVHILTLQDYFTEQQFVLALSDIVQRADERKQLLIVQCMAAEQNHKLVACARYLIEEKTKGCNGKLIVIQLLFLQRQNLCLSDMLHRWLNEGVEKINQPEMQQKLCFHINNIPFFSITTNHKLVAEEDGLTLALKCGVNIKKENVEVIINRDQNLMKSLERCIDRASAPENGIQLLIIQFSASEHHQPSWLASECRADINRELTKRNSERVRILLLISLPRIASFPGIHWDSFHLDDLVLEPGDLIDIGAIHDHPISDIISNPHLIDTHALIEQCVCQAASKIQDDSSRKFERIGLLAKMLENNDGFFNVLTRSVLAVLKENENRIDNNPADWLTKEAANSTRILERRTFRRALRNKIETDIENILCKILCLIDVAKNLNLLDTSPGFGDLWLQLFDDKSFFTEFNYHEVMFSKNEDLLKIEISSTSPCHYPFSWLLKSHLDSMITDIDEVTDSASVGVRAKRLSNQLSSTTWGLNVLGISKIESMTAYIEDFVNYTVTCRTSKASELIVEWLGRLPVEIMMKDTEIVWPIAVHLVYREIQNDIRRFVDFLELDQSLFDLLSDRKGQLEDCQYELDICVASLLVEQLTGMIFQEKSGIDIGQKERLTEVTAKRLFETRKRWIMRLNVFSPVIHRLFNEQFDRPLHFDHQSHLRNDKIQELSENWKTLEICALFLKHTMAASFPFKVSVIYNLFNSIKDTGVGSVDFLDKFETRARAYNRSAFMDCYGVRCSKIECAACQQLTCEHFSLLPCAHLIHKHCFENLARSACPIEKCQKILPDGFILVPETEKWQSFMQCRTALTTFFVDLVSQELFSYRGPPPMNVMEKLMQYVTGKKPKGDDTTGTLTPFSDFLGVDPTPVIRSYILQQLLKYDITVVLEHIDSFVRKYDQYLLSDSEKLDFLLICIGCVEDTLCARFAGLSPESCCHRLGQLLREIEVVNEPPTKIQDTSVQQIAHMRCCLNTAARLLPFINSHMDNDDARVCHLALSTYVKDCGDFIKNYLIKCIGRLHGVDFLNKLACSNSFNWLNPGFNLTDEQNLSTYCILQTEMVVDAYLVYGENYLELRQSVVNGLLSIDKDFPQKIAVEMARGDENTSVYLALCLLPVLSQFDLTNKPRVTLLHRICSSIPASGLRTTVNQVLTLKNPLLTKLRTSTENEMLTRLVYHALVAFSSETGSLFKFFNLLVSDPASLRNSYFPTMWEDNTAELLKIMKTIGENRTATLNYCPNNHPYFIGDCGAPNQSGRCYACDAMTGGQDLHDSSLATGNLTSANAIDQTKTGHCLGEVAALGNQLPSERKLSQLEAVLIRSIIHCAMLAAAATNKGVSTVITKGLMDAKQVNEFLRQHLEKDLADLGRILNHGLDDCAYIIHAVLARITSVGHAKFRDPLLTTRKARTSWEKQFRDVCLKPVYSEFNKILANLIQSIAKDPENDPLWQLVYEDDLKAPAEGDLSQLFHYRAPQTTEKLLHLAQEQINTYTDRDDLFVLRDFFEQLNHLSAVRYLPNILRLHSFIRSQFHGSIDLVEATNQTIEQFIRANEHVPEAQDLKLWIDDFFAAWRLVRDLVTTEQFALPDSHKNIVVYRLTDEFIPDLVNPYSNPLLALVPVPSHLGLGSWGLAVSLIRLQNKFVLSHKTQIGLPDDLETVLLKHAFAGGQILSFEIEHDVLPMLLMNRSFEFTVRSGTKTDVFDLFALQRQLVTKFLSQLVLLDSMVPLMKTKQNVLLECRQKLQMKFPQKELTEYQLRELVTDLHGDMNRVKQCLESAELILRFASSISGFPVDITMFLSDFLSKKLLKTEKDIDQLFRSYDISELNAVWSTLLFMNHLFVLIHDETHLFLNIPDALKQPISAPVTRSLLDTLKKCDQLSFLSHLTSFVTLYSDDIIGNVTEEVLEARLEEGLEDTFVVYEFEDDVEFGLPDSVQLKHTVTCWRIAAEAYRENQDM